MGQSEAKELKEACDEVVNNGDLIPRKINGKLITFCNIAVYRICAIVGYDNFADMTANDIWDYCARNWIIPYGEPQEKANVAQRAADIGDLAIAALKEIPHGHAAVIYPGGPMIYSGKWQMYSPRVANVGKTVGLMGANYAFMNPPDYFVAGKTLS